MKENKCWGVCKETERLEKQLDIYKKAYEMLAKAYCDKGECPNCDCKDICTENGYNITKDFFLQKAREE